MSKLFINVLKRCLPVVFIFLFIFEFQRSFSLFPKIYITIEVGSIQDKLTQGVSIYDVLGSWNTLAYFTVLSNLFFVLVFFLWLNIKIKNPFLNYSCKLCIYVHYIFSFLNLDSSLFTLRSKQLLRLYKRTRTPNCVFNVCPILFQ